MSTSETRRSAKLPVLDGWRATSILLVLAAHLIPLGPAALQLNHVAGAAGMALFFTLSGFLITRFLADGMEIRTFLVRRIARILPLAWLTMAALAVVNDASTRQVISNFLFYANLPPTKLFHGGEHLWSICVEIQFYAAVAATCLTLTRRGLYLIPAMCILVTVLRVQENAYISIFTWQRVDEILAGGTVALLYMGWFGDRARRFLSVLAFWPAMVLLVLTSHPDTAFLQYFRPYAAAALVAGTLVSRPPNALDNILRSKLFAYIAEISYALYMIHGVLLASWLNEGEKLVRYLKRPLLIVITFLLAHLSTRYFERPILSAARGYGRGRRTATLGQAPSPG